MEKLPSIYVILLKSFPPNISLDLRKTMFLEFLGPS